MIRAIRTLKADLPIEVTVEHIYGHQDDKTAYDFLPWMTQLNIQMDTQAKSYLRSLITEDTALDLPACPDSISGEGWTCRIDGIKMTADPAGHI